MNIKNAHWFYLTLFAICAGGILYLLLFYVFIDPLNDRLSIFNSSPIRNASKIYIGYTLVNPYNNILNTNPTNKGYIYLLDLFGREVHTWTAERQVLSSKLTRDATLVITMETPHYSQIYPGGGNTGVLQKLDWNSHVQWQYINDAMHHDFALMNNGDIAIALWERTPPAIERAIKGGVPDTELNGHIWSDEIVELNPSGNVIWSWHSYEHLDPAIDIIDPNLARSGWTYINGMFYVPKNPIDGEEAFVVSMRAIDTVFIIRKRDGAIIWRSPKGMLNTQHDPTVLANGDILVFDNGFTRIPVAAPIYGSRVLEINPKTNKIVWSFDGGPGVMDKLMFYAPLVGGAQPLPNGNILITDGPKGHIFEVTKKGEIVWDLINPYTSKITGSFPTDFLFKTRRYSTDVVNFPKTLAPPFSPILYFIYNILRPFYPS